MGQIFMQYDLEGFDPDSPLETLVAPGGVTIGTLSRQPNGYGGTISLTLVYLEAVRRFAEKSLEMVKQCPVRHPHPNEPCDSLATKMILPDSGPSDLAEIEALDNEEWRATLSGCFVDRSAAMGLVRRVWGSLGSLDDGYDRLIENSPPTCSQASTTNCEPWASAFTGNGYDRWYRWFPITSANWGSSS